jgi:hypothetical protein
MYCTTAGKKMLSVDNAWVQISFLRRRFFCKKRNYPASKMDKGDKEEFWGLELSWRFRRTKIRVQFIIRP